MINFDVTYSQFWPLLRGFIASNPFAKFFHRLISNSPKAYEVFYNDNGMLIRAIIEDSGDISNFEANYLALSSKILFRKAYQNYLRQDLDDPTNRNMDVRGDNTAVEFTLQPENGKTIIIEDIIFYTEDSNHAFDKIGDIYVKDDDDNDDDDDDGGGGGGGSENEEHITLSYTMDGQTSNLLLRSQTVRHIFLSTPNSFQTMDNSLRDDRSSADHFRIVIKPPSPIILAPGSSDNIKMTIAADLRGLDTFWVKCIGFEVPL